MSYLSWNLASQATYVAGGVLSTIVAVKAPEDGTYYLVGALYDSAGVIIPGTPFNVVEVIPTAINSSEAPTEYAMLADDEEELNCQFTLGQSDCQLGLFLMKMLGAAPSSIDDIQIADVTTSLVAPTTDTGGLDISTIMSMMIMVMVMAMAMKMMAE